MIYTRNGVISGILVMMRASACHLQEEMSVASCSLTASKKVLCHAVSLTRILIGTSGIFRLFSASQLPKGDSRGCGNIE